MEFEPLNSEPIDPRVIDAASGSVFTGERKGMSRWTPKWEADSRGWRSFSWGLSPPVILVVVALLLL